MRSIITLLCLLASIKADTIRPNHFTANNAFSCRPTKHFSSDIFSMLKNTNINAGNKIIGNSNAVGGKANNLQGTFNRLIGNQNIVFGSSNDIFG